MKDILDARNEINEIDKQMAQLFQKRMEAVKDVAVYKKDNGLSVRDLSREAEVAKRNSKFVTDESLKPYYVDFIRNTIDVSCKYQESLLRNMTVAYCGVEGGVRAHRREENVPDCDVQALRDFFGGVRGRRKGRLRLRRASA